MFMVLCAWFFVLCSSGNYFKLPSTKYKAQPTKKLRQATLAIACLYLTLTHLLRGGQVRAGVYACSEFLAMNSATPDQLFDKKDLALR
jgi:hypothetical protein